MSIFDSFVKFTVSVAETGLYATETAMKTAQAAIGSLAGIQTDRHILPPVDGPRDVDQAVTDFTTRAINLMRLTPRDPAALPGLFEDLKKSWRQSFQYVNLSDPKSLLLPFQVPLSFGTLMAAVSMRGLATLQVIGVPRYIDFISYSIEVFSDFPVYATLSYKELIERYETWLESHPSDTHTRLEFGRALIKVGRYRDAIPELRQASEAAEQRATAHYETAVAYFKLGDYDAAAASSSEALDADPGHERARMWLWTCAEKLGGYPAGIPASHRMEMKVGWEQPTVGFEDVAARIGIDKTSGGRGIAVFDYNHDGLLDIAIGAVHGGVSLYRNNGDGTFTDVSVGCGLDEAINAFGVTAGDYNNDGYPDIFISRMGFYPGEGELWRNNGDGTFTNVTEEAGVTCWGASFNSCWVDYDCDGHLDLFVPTNFGGLFDRKIDNRLFHNNGDGTFTEVGAAAGIHSVWPTIGAAWGDYNNDGYPDLFLSNAIGHSQLFRNNGNGTFTDVSAESGVNSFCFAFGAVWCDIDNDGWLDIVQFSWAVHEDVIYSMRTGETPQYGHPLRVYRNNRNGKFTDISREIGIKECWGSMSGNVADFNNDGRPDIILGNGGPLVDRMEPAVLLENDGSRFRNVTFAAGLPFAGKGHGAVCADLFGDGRLSFLVATGGAYPGDLLTMSVFSPKTRPGNYLNVRLKGVQSNRDAIGARLKLSSGGQEQHLVVNGGSNFGCLPCEQHFGLGRRDKADGLDIWWPSGLKQRFDNVPVNATIQIVEGEDRWTTR